MKAETAYNVIEALSSKEKGRLFQMLGVSERAAKKEKEPLMTDAEATEYLMRKLIGNKKAPNK